MKRILPLLLILSSLASNGQLNMHLEANMPYPGEVLANIGGYVDSLGNEYALVGTESGLDIVDVTVPSTPVSKFLIPGPQSSWREVKTYRKYAYVTTEGGGGLIIVDMSHLPDTVYYKSYTGDGAIAGQLGSIHALHCDTSTGFLYLYGSSIGDGNSLFFDLSDPWNPTYAGEYNFPSGGQDAYVHDGYVLNDTMYEAHIYAGFVAIVDVTNKSNPVLLATQTTPTAFTHNTWLSDDHHTMFTTDENTNSFLTAYDISNLSNIVELSRFQTAPGAIVHNTHILNDYAITSWYIEGVVIVDESRPRNPIEVGKYDTYSGPTGNGFHGDWGVYPFLPSGTIVASDIDNGLFVFKPTYIRGCYLEGVVRDSLTNGLLNGVVVQLLSTTITRNTDVLGEYRTGTVDSGLYQVRFSKPGYNPKIVSGVHLQNGVLTPLDVLLSPAQTFPFSGTVTDSLTGSPVANALVVLEGVDLTYSATANANGQFTFPGVIPDNYTMYAGKWGYRSTCQSLTLVQGMPLSAVLAVGYHDDFNLDLGWTVNGTSPNAWERADPVGTYSPNNTEANPDDDATSDCGENCFVTDNGGPVYSDHDVDGGNTVLTSPIFDATIFVNPTIRYYRRYQTFSGNPNDTMFIRISNGVTSAVLEAISPSDGSIGTWTEATFQLQTKITSTANMRLTVEVMDNMPGNIVEGAIDDFEVNGILLSGVNGISADSPKFNVAPNPFSDEIQITYELTDPSSPAELFVRDIMGRNVFRKKLAGMEGRIDVGKDLSAGVYLVSITNGNSSEIKKIVKE